MKRKLKYEDESMFSAFYRFWIFGLIPVVGLLFVFERAYHQFHWLSDKTFHSFEPIVLWFSIGWIISPLFVVAVGICRMISSEPDERKRRKDKFVQNKMDICTYDIYYNNN